MSLTHCNCSSLYIHSGHFRRRYLDLSIRRSFFSPSLGSRVSKSYQLGLSFPQLIGSFHPRKMVASVSSVGHNFHLGLTSNYRCMSLRLPVPSRESFPKISWNARVRHSSLAAGGISFGVCLGFSSSAEASMGNNKNNEHNKSRLSHGKKVHNDYSITGIPGDGRCLFRSLAHGACARAGKPVPNEALQVELADELRAMVADEFIKRREDTEWFIEGNFDDYVAHIRKPHVWGGEPELLMASHVLQMPITVYIHDHEAGGIIAIAEYGQEYGKEDPIRVLYHGFGHYDALQIPGKKTANSRL